MKKLYDITLPITEEMVSYPGSPPIRITPHDRIAAGDPANVTSLSFGSHTGTHVDAAHHFIDGTETVDLIPLDTLTGPCIVVAVPYDIHAIDAGILERADIRGEERVLLRTRNTRLLDDSDFREDFTFITGAGAAWLADAGVRLVGLDYLSVEAFDAEEPVAHRTLLGRGVVILEGADLRQVRPGRYELICLPLRIATDGAPVRAVLREL